MFILFLLLFIIACSSKEKSFDQEQNDSYSFQATIIDIENGLMVEPFERESEYSNSDAINVSTSDTLFLNKDGDKIKETDLQIGQEVEVYYDGMIAESYPAQIHHSGRVQLKNN